ncbi:MAG: peptidoglycan DD-metalloendopeptidase family protein [Gammaproteobacteria bacterium]|nr:peptidoglycan DD-metalloendopeptidase family protein [Gammaproteobacteria bacterium]
MRAPYPILPVLLALLLAAAGMAGSATRRQTEAELQAVRARIEAVTRRISQDAAQRDRLTRELKSSELALADARAELARLQDALAASRAHRAAVQRERGSEQRRLEAQRSELAAQLRAAYAIGRAEPLRLLLDQRDLAQAQRLFAYYGYFSRARAGQIAAIRARVARIDALDAELAAEETRLGQLQASREAALQQLASRHSARKRVLAGLNAESRTRSQSLARLKAQQADLEKLLRELARSIRSVPPAAATAFDRLRGRLDWPVQGRLEAVYGDVRAGGVRWEGILVATQPEAPVRAVAAGRVVYADWLPGLGLLSIVDHGSGYLSLYGYNARLEQSVGALVDAGEVIAAAGDTGGRPQPELYFEIRRSGKPVDPRPWFRTRRP